MKTLALQKRLAAAVLKVGQNKVWFDPSMISEIREAITKEDIKALIKEKAIKKKPIIGVKRRAGKKRQKRKRKGRGRGAGRKRKIVKKRKKEYMIKIRNLRSYIHELKLGGKIDSKESRKLRRLAKAGVFKSKKDIKEKVKIR
ncbi:MAG: 50S ribosomal protein L19e [Candidatus Pacearchaeota archaeon]|nr:MAG: 50S ribosomal protein L19e [Candidatus Pacearchaeota archaeon]